MSTDCGRRGYRQNQCAHERYFAGAEVSDAAEFKALIFQKRFGVVHDDGFSSRPIECDRGGRSFGIPVRS